MRAGEDGETGDRQGRILEAVINLLARDGSSGVSMAAVSREAGVSLQDELLIAN